MAPSPVHHSGERVTAPVTAAREDVPSAAAALPRPRHVAIIMDGNGRWARARGLPRIE
ncbi:MAG: isoprenyl transferase, partial [Planctomycetaceae bacterium]